jgi:ornithine cyclodeaminase/alanine dehydrogenase
MLLLRRPELEKILEMDAVIDAIDHVFVEQARGSVEGPPRHILSIQDAGGHSYVMPGYVGGLGALGVKVLNDFPRNDPSLGKAHGVVLLFDGWTGRPLAVMDAPTITAFRTGATSAVATKYLTPRDYRFLGVLGAGAQARTQILAIARVRPISSVKIWNRTPGRARDLGRGVVGVLGCQVAVAETPREAVAGSHIVVTATSSPQPLLMGEWLEPGMHINAIGGGSTREIDGEVIRRSKVVVDSRETALREAGDLREAITSGIIDQGDVSTELGEVIAGKAEGRLSLEQVTLFRSLGLAMEDVATAKLAYELAREAGVGSEVDFP